MNLPDCIGLNVNQAIILLRSENPYLKIVVVPTIAPRYKGVISLDNAMVVRQRLNDTVVELTVVMVD